MYATFEHYTDKSGCFTLQIHDQGAHDSIHQASYSLSFDVIVVVVVGTCLTSSEALYGNDDDYYISKEVCATNKGGQNGEKKRETFYIRNRGI